MTTGTSKIEEIAVDGSSRGTSPLAPSGMQRDVAAAPHILVVDDEEAIAYVFKRYLERAGYRVTAVTGPAEALASGSAGQVDMLVTDFRMPGMTGAGLIARLRALDPGLPALVVSAYGAEVATAADVRILNKPLPPQDLVEAVAQALAAARRHGPSGRSRSSNAE